MEIRRKKRWRARESPKKSEKKISLLVEDPHIQIAREREKTVKKLLEKHKEDILNVTPPRGRAKLEVVMSDPIATLKDLFKGDYNSMLVFTHGILGFIDDFPFLKKTEYGRFLLRAVSLALQGRIKRIEGERNIHAQVAHKRLAKVHVDKSGQIIIDRTKGERVSIPVPHHNGLIVFISETGVTPHVVAPWVDRHPTSKDVLAHFFNSPNYTVYFVPKIDANGRYVGRVLLVKPEVKSPGHIQASSSKKGVDHLPAWISDIIYKSYGIKPTSKSELVEFFKNKYNNANIADILAEAVINTANTVRKMNPPPKKRWDIAMARIFDGQVHVLPKEKITGRLDTPLAIHNGETTPVWWYSRTDKPHGVVVPVGEKAVIVADPKMMKSVLQTLTSKHEIK